MVRDRTDALKAFRDSTSIEMTDYESTGIDDVYKQVEQISTSIDTLNKNIEEVKMVNSMILSAPQTDEAVKKKLDSITNLITKDANIIKSQLKSMEKDIDDDKSSSTQRRIKVTQYRMLFRRFKEAVEDYQTSQADHRDRCKARIKRQLDITGHIKTNDEIEDMIESNNPAIFNAEIIIDSQQAKQSLAEIQERHSDILKLEKSISALRDLFVDVAILVEEQGEIVNRIENHVAEAKEHVDQGFQDVTQAVKFRSQARCKKIICFTILILILAAVVFSTFFSS